MNSSEEQSTSSNSTTSSTTTTTAIYDPAVEHGDGIGYTYRIDIFFILGVSIEIYTALSIICALVNITIAALVFKYRRLRQDNANIILANWCIVNTLFMLSSPFIIRLIFRFTSGPLGETTFCIVEQIECTLLFCNIVQMILLTFYWYYKSYDQIKFEKYMRSFKFFLIAVYVLSLCSIGVHIDSCYNRRAYTISEILLLFTHGFFLVFMIVMNILNFIRRRRQRAQNVNNNNNKPNVHLMLTNTFFISVLPLLFVIFISVFARMSGELLVALICLSLMIAICNPMYFFFILFKYHDDFNMFFKHILTCKCRKYSDDRLLETPVVYCNENVEDENKC